MPNPGVTTPIVVNLIMTGHFGSVSRHLQQVSQGRSATADAWNKLHLYLFTQTCYATGKKLLKHITNDSRV